jgi:polysaccharide deacetylase family protein (PEP-CTERM system associated)
MSKEQQNALTVDVEDYYHVSAFESHVPRDTWDRYESRVVRNTHRVLGVLAAHGVRATFFVLGWVADRFPQLIDDIDAAGHEIGSHGYWHRLIYTLTPEEFRADVVRARNVLEDRIGKPVVAYRAPSFSITRRSLWAFEVLASEGFQLDSSVFPIRHDRYGIPGARRDVHRVETAGGHLWEFPVSAVRLGWMNLPVSGGGYFRLYPLGFTKRCLSRINLRENRPFVFYIHPWEFDADQPRLKAGSRLSRLRHYVNIARTEPKFNALLSSFRFGTLSQSVAAIEPDAEPVRLGREEAPAKTAGQVQARAPHDVERYI